MDKRVLFAMALIFWPLVTFSSIPNRPGFIGILEHNVANRTLDQRDFEPKIPVRAEAGGSAGPVIGEVTTVTSAEAFEWNYEEPGIAVYGYVHDGTSAWYKIYVTELGQFGWISARPDLIFHPLSEIVTSSLAYLTSEWNKVLFADPTAPQTASTLTVSANEIPIEVATTAIVDGKLWVLVVVLRESPCASAEAPPVLGAGWVPAASQRARLNIWFFSRGC